jgi:hypothetical protein
LSWSGVAALGLPTLGLAGLLLAEGCKTAETPGPKPAEPAAPVVSMYDGGGDMSRCDQKRRNDREVLETAGPGTTAPNVRRVYRVVDEGEEQVRVLICSEVDTDLDGSKDVVRIYSDRGDPLSEQADANYDGRIDTWITFAGGQVARMEFDRDRDGRPDELQQFIDGGVSRIERDTNRDGRSDIWEIYEDGRLRRMGVDLDHDGHVDRWDRDQVVVRLEEEQEREAEQRASRERGSRRRDTRDAGVSDARARQQ